MLISEQNRLTIYDFLFTIKHLYTICNQSVYCHYFYITNNYYKP